MGDLNNQRHSKYIVGIINDKERIKRESLWAKDTDKRDKPFVRTNQDYEVAEYE